MSSVFVTLSQQFEEQQAFERSRRFLRQLEISFGDNPSHYQKIIKALQTGPDLSPTSIHEVPVITITCVQTSLTSITNYSRLRGAGPRKCASTINYHESTEK